MATAHVPVDLRNPGQVFACLGLMEGARLLCGPDGPGSEAQVWGRFAYESNETDTQFELDVPDSDAPVTAVLDFLCRAQVRAEAPAGTSLADKDRGITTTGRDDSSYPGPAPGSPATLVARLADNRGHALRLAYWLDGSHNGRDNVKFWAGAGGYSGAALTRDALGLIAELAGGDPASLAADPFNAGAVQSSSFRFDWRRDYVPVEVGFSLNRHSRIETVGYPVVEVLAALGVSYARPARVDPRDKLTYRYGVWATALPPILARPALGGASPGVGLRTVTMHLDWPGQEGQARCIVDTEEA